MTKEGKNNLVEGSSDGEQRTYWAKRAAEKAFSVELGWYNWQSSGVRPSTNERLLETADRFARFIMDGADDRERSARDDALTLAVQVEEDRNRHDSLEDVPVLVDRIVASAEMFASFILDGAVPDAVQAGAEGYEERPS